jgi:hypothetical protein
VTEIGAKKTEQIFGTAAGSAGKKKDQAPSGEAPSTGASSFVD